jgi:hypothetical protein
MNLIKAFILTLLFFSMTPAYAIPILTGHNTIYDSKSGLEWMQLTETEFLSWNEVENLLKYDSSFVGWRFATITDINELLSSYSSTSPTPEELASSGWNFSSANFGLYSGEHIDSGGQVRMFDLSRTGTFNYFTNISAFDTKFVDTGSYIVRIAQVPEPTSLLILLFAMMSMIMRSQIKGN